MAAEFGRQQKQRRGLWQVRATEIVIYSRQTWGGVQENMSTGEETGARSLGKLRQLKAHIQAQRGYIAKKV